MQRTSIFFIFVFIFFVLSCNKNEKDSQEEVIIEPDYRDKYLGDYTFVISPSTWFQNQSVIYDDVIYESGIIQKGDSNEIIIFYKDSINYDHYDQMPATLVTNIDDQGKLSFYDGWHHFTGEFIANDSLVMNIYWNGMNGGFDEIIRGKKHLD